MSVKPISHYLNAMEKHPHLEEIADLHAKLEIARIKEHVADHPDDEFSKANQHVLKDLKKWKCTGALQFVSAFWWGLTSEIAFIDGAPQARLFSAKGGPDWAAATFSGVFLGYFYEDPDYLPDGRYDFNLTVAAHVAGAFHFNLYRGKKLIGDVSGLAAPAVGAAWISGTGDLYNPANAAE